MILTSISLPVGVSDSNIASDGMLVPGAAKASEHTGSTWTAASCVMAHSSDYDLEMSHHHRGKLA